MSQESESEGGITEGVNSLAEHSLVQLGEMDVTIGSLISIAIYVFLALIFLRLIRRFIMNRLGRKMEQGRRKAIYNLVRYLVWLILIYLIFEAIGIQLGSFIVAGGVFFVLLGFGLQQIFKDFVSGIILQIEGSISVGDVIELEGLIGVVKEVHVRTSIIQTRDDIVMIVPNHRFVEERVINWSHIQRNTRFLVNVGVAYGSDVDHVEKVLLQCMHEQAGISDHPAPRVWLSDFGESSLDFDCYFWSTEAFGIEAVKSDLRFRIVRKFAENGIQIPFPQRDVHVHQN